MPPKPSTVTVEEWELTITEYRRIYTEIIEWCTEQITIIRKKKVPSRVEDAETMLREFTGFQNDMKSMALVKSECKDLYLTLLTMASRSRGAFSGPDNKLTLLSL